MHCCQLALLLVQRCQQDINQGWVHQFVRQVVLAQRLCNARGQCTCSLATLLLLHPIPPPSALVINSNSASLQALQGYRAPECQQGPGKTHLHHMVQIFDDIIGFHAGPDTETSLLKLDPVLLCQILPSLCCSPFYMPQGHRRQICRDIVDWGIHDINLDILASNMG